MRRLFSYPYCARLRGAIIAGWRSGSVVHKPLIFTSRCVSLGAGVGIWPNCRIEGVFSYMGRKFSPEIIIGNGVSIQQNLHLTCAQHIEIGSNTAIAANVTITDIDHPYQQIDIPIEQQPILTQPVLIGADCKIYNNSVILPGTTIGHHCVVGANSVVNGIFDHYCVIVGAPARVVKKYSFETNQWEKI